MSKSKRKFGVIVITLIGIIISMIFVKHFLFKVQYSLATENIQPKIETCLDKYVNYNLSNQDKGTLVQYTVKTGINNAENIEIEESKVNISLNQIDNKYPFDVKVIDKNSLSVNSSYDSNTGDLLIISDNPTGEYIIICYYDTFIEDAIDREIGFNINVIDVIANAENNEVSKEGTFNTTVTESISSLTSVKHSTDDIYNGYMKSNIINGTNYETNYKDTAEIMVSKKEAQEELVLVENNKLMQDAENEIDNNQNLVVKSTKVRKDNILNVLGQEGTLQLLDLDENTLAEVNKDTEFAEDGTYTINYESQPEGLIIKTSKITNEGIISLENIKAIKPTYNEAKKIKTKNQLIGTTEDNEEKETIVDIKNAESKIDLNINNEEWTNERQNELVFDVLLNTNGSQYNLYKNPTIKIELPDVIEKVVLGESSLLYGSGLELQNVNLEKNNNGNFVVTAKLNGAQTEYDINNLGLTTNIKIPLTVILKQDIDSSIKNISVYYSNEYTVDGSIENRSFNKNIRIENFRENEVTQEILDLQNHELFNKLTTNEVQANIDKNLKLEVAPTMGETVISDGDIVYEGEFIKYNIKVTNTADEDIDNVKVVATIPDGVTYGELYAEYDVYHGEYKYNFENETRQKEINIGTIKAEESKVLFYEVRINDLNDGEEQKDIENRIVLYAGENEEQSYENTFTVKNAEAKVLMTVHNSVEGEDYWYYEVSIESESIKNYPVKIHLPEEFEIESEYEIINGQQYGAKIGLNFEKENDVIITTLSSNYTYMFQGRIDTLNIQKNPDGTPVEKTAYIELIGENATYISNENRMKVSYECIEVTMSSENEGSSVKIGDEINYEITVKNVGGFATDEDEVADTVEVILSDFLPEEVDADIITYTNWEYELEDNYIKGVQKKENIEEDISGTRIDEEGNKQPDVDVELLLPKGECTTINVKTIAKEVESDTTIENNATLSGTTIETKKSNTVTHTILAEKYESGDDTPDDPSTPDKPSEPDTPSNSDEPSSPDRKDESNKTISGAAWLDQNEDGQRQESEDTLNGIEVFLVNMQDTSKEQAKTVTNRNGLYEFSNLNNGKYLILFKYDTNMYRITEYQKNGVNSSKNSDATNKKITFDGQQILVGITDTIELGENKTNIDIGLVEKKKYDLKIEKYISTITIKTKKGTKEYNYNNKVLAKAEIKAKEIEGAIVTINYKIIVTNVGDNSCKIGNIIDTLPDGLNYNSNLNSEWNKNGNNKLINYSLSNQTLDPGNSAQLSLTATKTMTSDSTGIFTNNVEISSEESSEISSDKDLTNNSAKADVIISISTGAMLYITLAMIVFAILISILVILSKKGKININRIKITKTTKFLAFFIAMFLIVSDNSYVNAWTRTQTYKTIAGSKGKYTWYSHSGNTTVYKGEHGTVKKATAYCMEPELAAAGRWRAWQEGSEQYNPPFAVNYNYVGYTNLKERKSTC